MHPHHYVSNEQYKQQKSRLTRAQNTGNATAILDAVEKTLNEWEGKAWPDDWHRWQRALHDAYFTFVCQADPFLDGANQALLQRFEEIQERLQ